MTNLQLKTPQEEFWAGEFGDDYIARNRSDQLLASKTALFARILARTEAVETVLELGANIGINLQAVQRLRPSAALTGVEINAQAHAELIRQPNIEAHHASLLDWRDSRQFDLTFSCTVLIHINPDELGAAYDALYQRSRRYIALIEYYNPSLIQVNYRGHNERLFKRDFPGEMLDRYDDLRLVDYGFVYHRDPVFPGDDLSWFLLEKR